MKKVNGFVCVRKSKVHGTGVFALKDIPKGAKVIEYVGRKITKRESDDVFDKQFAKYEKNKKKYPGVYLFELNKKYDIDGDVSWNPAKYINHSCEPNCETDIIKGQIWIISIKNIKKGEEISYDYGYDLENYKDHPCWCGSKNCVGYIVAEEHWPKLNKKS
jgi:uncharacterized protein